MTYKLTWKDCLAGDIEYFATQEEAIEALKNLDECLFVSLVNEDKYQAERKTELFPEDAMEFMVKFVRALSGVLVENRKLREALTFYAKGEHLGLEDWQTEQVLKHDDVFAESYCETGKVAREALKGGEKC